MSELTSEVTGTVWKVLATEGQAVHEGDAIMIVESMKMEIPVQADAAGMLEKLHVKEGDSVTEGMKVATVA